MSSRHPALRVRLFYSYSHRDMQHREAMQKILATLKRNRLLQDWSDAQIDAGQSISQELQEKLLDSDIVAFLLSPDFLDSDACIEEWQRAKQLAEEGRLLYRVPIIVRQCPWKDFLGDDDLKALPDDGMPVTQFDDADVAWQQVYEGIRQTVETLRTTHTPKTPFLEEFDNADLPSSNAVPIDDIFVFPHLLRREYSISDPIQPDPTIGSLTELLDLNYAVIHGYDRSGKTALAKHIYLYLVKDEQPVLFVDLATIARRPNESVLRSAYEEQFHGEYSLWKQRPNKTLIFDNMTDSPRVLDFIAECHESFERIILLVSTDIYHSFFTDELRLAEFEEISIEPFTHIQQERLIRKGIPTLDRAEPITDGFVNQAEDRVNSVIISNRVVPRYPFFILAILQTYGSFVPSSFAITSYGHCYYIFIVASLNRAGVSESDEALNSAFNFAEQLALAQFLASRDPGNETFEFEEFLEGYREEFLIRESLLNRLVDGRHGIVTKEGTFRSAYMYYFFLGKILATSPHLAQEHLPDLCDRSYIEANYLTLLFAIHHATDNDIIDEIQLRTMVELGNLEIASLGPEETARFAGLVSELPESVLSEHSIEEERTRERELKDNLEEPQDDEVGDLDGEQADLSGINTLRVLKNTRVLGQVLRNHYGKLQRRKVEEIVETITDSCFRLINLLLKDEDEIHKAALVLSRKVPDADLSEIRQLLRYASFLWTMANIELAVHSANVPSIREAIDAVVGRNEVPSYEIFGYFCELDNSEELTQSIRDKLAALYRAHDDDFIKRVVSLRTQFYMNTHRSRTAIEQSVCSVLEIQYKPRRPKLNLPAIEQQ